MACPIQIVFAYKFPNENWSYMQKTLFTVSLKSTYCPRTVKFSFKHYSFFVDNFVRYDNCKLPRNCTT